MLETHVSGPAGTGCLERGPLGWSPEGLFGKTIAGVAAHLISLKFHRMAAWPRHGCRSLTCMAARTWPCRPCRCPFDAGGGLGLPLRSICSHNPKPFSTRRSSGEVFDCCIYELSRDLARLYPGLGLSCPARSSPLAVLRFVCQLHFHELFNLKLCHPADSRYCISHG